MKLLDRHLPCGVLLLLYMLLIGACASGEKKGAYREEGASGAGADMESPMPMTIAVLPFLDKTGSQQASEIVRRGFFNHFSSLSFSDMELVKVDSLLRKAGLTDAAEIHRTPPSRLKEILNVDGFIFGVIENFNRLFAVVYSQVAVGADVSMIDAEGRIVWNDKRTARIHEGGASLNPIGLIAAVVGTSMNMREIQLLRASDDLFREMVKTIPTPKATHAALPPEIRLVVQDTQGKPLKVGDELRVAMEGQPGMQAWFDIADYKKGIDMKELEPGGYLGTYRVESGDNIENATVIGYLSDKAGSISRWTDALGSVTMDTIEPDAPLNLVAHGGDLTIDLEWERSRATDLADYIVFRSETPLSGFEDIGKTEFAKYTDKSVANLKPYYYKITAVDRAGNRSSAAEPVQGTAIPSGPTPVSGTLPENTFWFCGAGPYVFEETVTVSPRATLTIEPGTRIETRGHGLIVQGRLVAEGTSSRLIVFESGGKETPDQTWPGVLFDQSVGEPGRLAFCRISGADTAVTCRSSSPAIVNCELTGNTNGVALSGGFSAPAISVTLVRGNREAGILIGDGARPEITDCRIIENTGCGISITGAGKAVIRRNTIVNNSMSGIVLKDSSVLLEANSIYDNTPWDLTGQPTGIPIDIGANWWGRTDWRAVIDRIQGRFHLNRILDGPDPDGKPTTVPIAREVRNTVDGDLLLTQANSPYEIIGEIAVNNGATMHIQSGVVLKYHKQAAIQIHDGGVLARGTKDMPVVMTSASAIPSPGDYASALGFLIKSGVSTTLQYCRIEYATMALDVRYGRPEITHCYIADNSQGGIRCINDASPVIRYSTFARNMGSGAIECRGMANPKIQFNNFMDNMVAIQAFSSIYIDARDNYWGRPRPDDSVIWAENMMDNIRIEPFSDTLRTDAFCPTCE